MKCVLCKKEFDRHGNNAEPLAKGFCCDQCNVKVITARQSASKWSKIVLANLYQTCGINHAIGEDDVFAQIIMWCVGKYLKIYL